jgi:3-oxoacyl-[acyl-carrier protein] reductase
VINYQSNVEAALAVKSEIESAGGEAELLPFDVGNLNEVESAIDKWESAHSEDYIAYLINNAGIRRDGMMFMMGNDDWHDVLNTSLNGFFYVTRKLITKMMMRKHGGRVVNMASFSGVEGVAGQTNYSAAKAALIGATKALAKEVAPRGVTVNAVAPGFIESDMTRDLNEEELKQTIPMRRFGKAEEVASLVAYLVSDESSYITGEVININGGL